MIRTLYRPDDAVRIPAPVFDPDAVADPGSVDELVGAVPSWRLDDDPLFWELVRDGLAPVDVAAAALEVVPWLLERLVDDPAVVEVSDPSQVDEDVVEDVDNVAEDVDLPTRALSLVADNVAPDVACPDCGATGLEPCRPKNRPTGTPLPRWHTRRRRLADTGSTSVLWLVILLVAVVVSGVVGLLVTSLSGLEDELRRPCPVPTAASCPDGPGGAR